jgi:DNA-binding IclR family transcriptional regulator
MTMTSTYTEPTMVERSDDEDSPQQGRGVAAVQSVDRALLVLEILAKFGTAGITEIATELGVHKSTVSRLVAVLESRGFVEQLSDRGKYRLGFSIVRLAGSTSARMDLAKQSQEVCDALALESGEIINIVEAIGPAEISLRSWVGQSCPAHATSSGKVLLSGLSTREVHARLGKRLESFTPNTVTSIEDLDAELDAARRDGWAAVREELEVGLNAVAAPIRDNSSAIVAALSVSGPTYRMDSAQFTTVSRMAIDAASKISMRLGYTG